jgi:serine/threonine-protein kinase
MAIEPFETPRAAALPTSLVRLGSVLAGKYVVERVLGVGGMGAVLAARNVRLGQRVAIKVLLPSSAPIGARRAGASAADVAATEARRLDQARGHEHDLERDRRRRFVREGRALSRMRSEHAVRVLDVLTLEKGAPALVLEYLDGVDLADLVRDGGPLPLATAVAYVLQACEALAEAHALGMVHRDVKPANLFLTRAPDGSPWIKLLDFGITQYDDPYETALGTMPHAAALIGSPRYMAPEQVRGGARVDARTDIWGVGTVLFELVTGRPAFDANTLTELCAQIVADRAPAVRDYVDVPRAFDNVVKRCLEKRASDRFRSLEELAAALSPFAPREAKDSVTRVSAIVVRSRRGAAIAQDDACAPDVPSRPTKKKLTKLTKLTPRRVGATLSAAGACAFALALGASAAASNVASDFVHWFAEDDETLAHANAALAGVGPLLGAPARSPLSGRDAERWAPPDERPPLAALRPGAPSAQRAATTTSVEADERGAHVGAGADEDDAGGGDEPPPPGSSPNEEPTSTAASPPFVAPLDPLFDERK